MLSKYHVKEFQLDRILWKNVYQTKVKFIDDPLVSEFNYKLLNNLLSNNLFLSKWKNLSPFCTSCSDVIENTKHLIFECTNVRKIWKIIGIVLNFEIQWKHKYWLLSFNDKVNSLNNLISFIACRIYKFKMYCRLELLKETEYTIRCHLKKHVLFNYNVLKLRKLDLHANYYSKIADIL